MILNKNIRSIYLIFVKLTINLSADSLNSLSLFAYRQAKIPKKTQSKIESKFFYQMQINYQIHDNIVQFHKKLHHTLPVFVRMYHQM
jgi:hypothetical protein